MAHGLKALVVDVQGASAGVSLGASEAAAIGERVRGGAMDEHAGVVAVQGAVETKKGSELERAMEAATQDVDQLGAVGSDAQARLGHLEALAGHAGSTLSAVKASMSTLERAASESEATADLVADM